MTKLPQRISNHFVWACLDFGWISFRFVVLLVPNLIPFLSFLELFKNPRDIFTINSINMYTTTFDYELEARDTSVGTSTRTVIATSKNMPFSIRCHRHHHPRHHLVGIFGFCLNDDDRYRASKKFRLYYRHLEMNKTSIIFIKSIMISWICNFHFVKLVAHSFLRPPHPNAFHDHQFRYEYQANDFSLAIILLLFCVSFSLFSIYVYCVCSML